MDTAGKQMKVTQSVQMFGHTFTIWQGDGPAVILQVDDVYLAADADENGNMVIPHQMVITNNFTAIQEICAAVNETGASIALVGAYLRRKAREKGA